MLRIVLGNPNPDEACTPADTTSPRSLLKKCHSRSSRFCRRTSWIRGLMQTFQRQMSFWDGVEVTSANIDAVNSIHELAYL